MCKRINCIHVGEMETFEYSSVTYVDVAIVKGKNMAVDYLNSFWKPGF